MLNQLKIRRLLHKKLKFQRLSQLLHQLKKLSQHQKVKVKRRRRKKRKKRRRSQLKKNLRAIKLTC